MVAELTSHVVRAMGALNSSLVEGAPAEIPRLNEG